MKSTTYEVIRYDAENGMVFDWKEPRYIKDIEGNIVKQEHLYATTLFIGSNDSIENYIEIPAPKDIE